MQAPLEEFWLQIKKKKNTSQSLHKQVFKSCIYIVQPLFLNTF